MTSVGTLIALSAGLLFISNYALGLFCLFIPERPLSASARLSSISNQSSNLGLFCLFITERLPWAVGTLIVC